MRFSCLVGAAVLLFAPASVPAQEAVSEGDAVQAPAETAAQRPPFVQKEACLTELTSEFEAALGEPVAWPDEGHTVHTPAGLSVLDRPVSYVLVKRSGGRIEEIGYRLRGVQRKVGQPHDAALLRSFDQEFEGAKCSNVKESSCGISYRSEGAYTGAQIGSGEVFVARNARGPSLALVKADYDLLDSDPVFLVCYYRGG